MKRQAGIGYGLGTALALLGAYVLFLPGQQRLQASGPANPGHESLKCGECHRPVLGSARQQIQSNLFKWVGAREHSVPFQYRQVSNSDCMACHDRPNDHHPAHRFLEPRFATARAKLSPHRCVSCHREHQGKRVTTDTTFCVHCHKTLKIKKDPLDVKHWQLIAVNAWSSCLTCHDFHGNHVMKVASAIDMALESHRIDAYFDGGPSPYPLRMHYRAKRNRDE